MRPTHFFVLCALLILSCAPLKKTQVAKTDVPSLGVLGKDEKSLIAKNFQQVGRPVISRPIAVSVSELPFTKTRFKTYSDLKAQRGQQIGIKYVDSIAEKPKYYRLEIKDKISLKAQLNAAQNSETLAYLTKDASCKIVSGVSFYAHPMETEYASNDKNIFLTTDAMGGLRIVRIHNGKKQQIAIPESEIFEYALTGFCWGEDIYGKPRIELLNEGGSCPEGTEKNAQKLVDNNSFLKL